MLLIYYYPILSYRIVLGEVIIGFLQFFETRLS